MGKSDDKELKVLGGWWMGEMKGASNYHLTTNQFCFKIFKGEYDIRKQVVSGIDTEG